MVGGRRDAPMDSTLVSTGKTGDGASVIPRRIMVGTGQNVTTHVVPDEGIIMVGRAPDATIRVDDSSVSRLHVRIHLGEVLRVEDLGSANGTRMGGERLPPNQLIVLPPGQVLEIGSSWLMVANPPLSASITRAIADPAEASGPGREADGLIVRDPSMRALHRLIERVALSDISVLLLRRDRRRQGGVRASASTRCRRARDKPFVRPQLRGARRVAARERAVRPRARRVHRRGHGQARACSRPPTAAPCSSTRSASCRSSIQVKLLRVLEERQVLPRRRRASRAPIDVRVRRRHQPRPRGRGRRAARSARDLYFRLNGITLEIPPLRERRGGDPSRSRARSSRRCRRTAWARRRPSISTPALATGFAATSGPATSASCATSSSARCVLAEGGPITARPPAGRRPTSARLRSRRRPSRSLQSRLLAGARSIADAERERILAALERCAGNQTRAAELLGISRRTLVSRLSSTTCPARASAAMAASRRARSRRARAATPPGPGAFDRFSVFLPAAPARAAPASMARRRSAGDAQRPAPARTAPPRSARRPVSRGWRSRARGVARLAWGAGGELEPPEVHQPVAFEDRAGAAVSPDRQRAMKRRLGLVEAAKSVRASPWFRSVLATRAFSGPTSRVTVSSIRRRVRLRFAAAT